MPLLGGLRVQCNTCYAGDSTPLHYPAFRCGEFTDHFNADTFVYGMGMHNDLLHARRANYQASIGEAGEAGEALTVTEEAHMRGNSLPFANSAPSSRTTSDPWWPTI